MPHEFSDLRLAYETKRHSYCSTRRVQFPQNSLSGGGIPVLFIAHSILNPFSPEPATSPFLLPDKPQFFTINFRSVITYLNPFIEKDSVLSQFNHLPIDLDAAICGV